MYNNIALRALAPTLRKTIAALANFNRIIVCTLCTLALAAGLQAEQRELKSDAAEQLDAVLLLDASGSMLLTDPLRLRDEGVRLFLQFLKSGDRLGVVQFAEDAAVVRPLTPFSSDQIESVSKQITGIGATGQYTDILAGINTAKELLLRNPSEDARQVIILLSDGKMDPDPAKGTPQAFSEKLLGESIPELKARGARIYTLAFSDKADRDLLRQIAAAGDGVNWFTPTADKIHESYAELFLAVKKPQVIPLSGKGFSIDGEVQEATFYINRENNSEIKIETPSGAVLTPEVKDEKIKWFRGQKFDVITIEEPEIGNWQVLGISPQDGFATILTNLKLVTDWPNSVESESYELLQARLYEGKKPVDLPEMAQVIRYAFQITPNDRISEPIIREFLSDDGANGDKIAKDGIFSYRLKLDEPGEYRLRILAKAPTFERQQQIPFRVKPALITLKAISPEEAAEEEKAVGAKNEGETKATPAAGEHKDASQNTDQNVQKGSEETLFHVELSEDARLLRNLQVKLIAVDVQRNRYLLPINPSIEVSSRYEASAASLPSDGKFELQASLTAVDPKGKGVKENSHLMEFTRITAGSKPVEQAVVVVQPEKPNQPSWFPFLGVLMVSVVNVGVGSFCVMLLRKSQGKMVLDLPDFKIPAEIYAGIEAAEKKVADTEIDLNSPLFADEAAPPAAPEPAAPQQPEPAPSEPAPEPAPEG
jgi:uncharacterized protein (TIGR03503 family)